MAGPQHHIALHASMPEVGLAVYITYFVPKLSSLFLKGDLFHHHQLHAKDRLYSVVPGRQTSV